MLLLGYAGLIIGASLVGGWLPMVLRLTHTRLQVVISAVAGFMLGVALLHLLPHALLDAGTTPPKTLMGAVLAGFLAVFLLERFFSFHTHELPGVTQDGGGDEHQDHGHSHGQNHEHEHEHEHGRGSGWLGAMVGLSVHSVLAGFALAAAFASDASLDDPDASADPHAGHDHHGHDHHQHGHGGHDSHGVDGAAGFEETLGLPGLAVLLAILAHKPLDSFTVLALAHRAGLSGRRAHLLNAVFALAVPLGLLLGVAGLSASASPVITSFAVAFAAGTFLCVSLSDLLPEVHFHRHDRVKLTLSLLLGLGLAAASAWVEAVLMH